LRLNGARGRRPSSATWLMYRPSSRGIITNTEQRDVLHSILKVIAKFRRVQDWRHVLVRRTTLALHSVGTRTIVAIRLDHTDAQRHPSSVRTIEFAEAEAEGWFNGPPYAAMEHVFDEDSIVDYPLAPDSGIP
jgi:hypothetical protein